MKQSHARYARIYRLFRAWAAALARGFLRAQVAPLPRTDGPFLLLLNHNTDIDPLLAASSTREHMYFVSSEHALRKGAASWLLRFLFAPIARRKGSTDAAAAMAILRTLREGANVCLFPEGNRSFNGRTGPIFPATGKMVKAAGCSMITYRLEGGYLTTPRWAFSVRRGRMKGYPVRLYAPQELAAMTAEEINAAIARDLAEDAFDRQAAQHLRFCGKRLAEGLETALFLCPVCGGVGTLRGAGNRFGCACGVSAVYTEEGFFEDGPFATVAEWDAWQQRNLYRVVERGGCLFSDDNVCLDEICSGRACRTAQGTLMMDAQGLRIGGQLLRLDEISDMAVVGRGTLVFTWAGRYCQLKAGPGFGGRKYFLLYQYLKAERG